MDEFVAFLARRLPDHSIETAVLLAPMGPSNAMGPIAHDLLNEGITVVQIAGVEAEEWIRDLAPDVVAVHGRSQWPVDVARTLGIPAILVLHGMHDLFDFDEGEVLARHRGFAGVVSVSEMVRQQYLAKSRLINPSTVVTVPNGIHPPRSVGLDKETARAALGLQDEFLFLSLSRHCLQKNTYGLVDAFGDVIRQNKNAHLLVCGRVDDVEYTNQVLGLRGRMRGAGRIHLRGNTRRTDVLLAAADAFVLDSFFEGWALSSMEALVAGLPIVISDVGGAREQLTGGPSRGILVPNPGGDPLEVNWTRMSQARFAKQGNRDELVASMISLIDGSFPIASPDEIAGDAVTRFSATLCVERHASVLRAIAAARTTGTKA